MDEEIFVKLRDCFTAGYTLPQFCIDNGIKKPLFVSERKYELFVWQVYVQFHYDKRLTAQFCCIDADDTPPKDFRAHTGIIIQLRNQNFSAMNLDAFDKIILLTKENINANANKIIRFIDLEAFFIRRTYAEIPLLDYVRRHPKVKLFMTRYPSPWRYKDAKEHDAQLCSVGEFTARLINDKSGNVKTTLDKFGYTNAQILEIASVPQVKTNLDGTTILVDDNTKPLQGIKNGKRITAHQPATYKNKIYFFGPCIFYGAYAPFDKTLESYLQKMLNNANLPYRVENYSQFIWGRTQDILYNLNTLNPAPDDIIFVTLETLIPNSAVIPYVDISDVFDPPNDYRKYYCVKGHINELGYKLMAERYFKFLTKNNFFHNVELKYPAPPPNISQIWYTSLGRAGRRNFKYRQRRIRSLQRTT